MSTNPSLRMSRQKQPPSEGRVAARLVLGLLALTNIVTALIAIVFVLAVRWFGRDKIRGWHILTAGIISIGIGFAAGWTQAYGAPWVELVDHIADNLPDLSNLGTFVAANAGQWTAGQIPFAICVALTIAGAYLLWRDRYRKTWGAAAKKPPRPASQHAVTVAKRKLDAKVMKMDPVATPNDLAIPIGVDTTTAKPVTIAAKSFRTHSVVVGPTGLGKTEALERVIWSMTAQPAARELKIPAIVIDMKGDPALARWMEANARALGRPFHKITTDEATSTGGYVALAGRTPDEIADMVYEMVFAGDPNLNQHYATLSRRLLQVASHTLVDLAGTVTTGGRRWQVNLPDLARLCSLSELRLAMATVNAPVAERISRYLNDIEASKNSEDVGDVRDRLAVITDTAMGDILAQDGLNLKQAIQQGAFVCFSLDAAASPESARVMGRLAVQDISATFGALAGTPWAADGLCPIVLDEFSALASGKVADLFARVRSAGGAVILSTQDLDGDLTAVSAEFAATVRTNANVWLVLRQTRGELAESIASDIGTVKTWKETVQVEDDWDMLGGLHAASGVGSLREVDEFAIHPNEIRSLAQGAAIVMVKTPDGSLHKHDAATELHRVHISQALHGEHAAPQLPPVVHRVPAETGPAPQPTAPAAATAGFEFDDTLAGDDDLNHMPAPEPPADEEP